MPLRMPAHLQVQRHEGGAASKREGQVGDLVERGLKAA